MSDEHKKPDAPRTTSSHERPSPYELDEAKPVLRKCIDGDRTGSMESRFTTENDVRRYVQEDLSQEQIERGINRLRVSDNADDRGQEADIVARKRLLESGVQPVELTRMVMERAPEWRTALRQALIDQNEVYGSDDELLERYEDIEHMKFVEVEQAVSRRLRATGASPIEIGRMGRDRDPAWVDALRDSFLEVNREEFESDAVMIDQFIGWVRRGLDEARGPNV